MSIQKFKNNKEKNEVFEIHPIFLAGSLLAAAPIKAAEKVFDIRDNGAVAVNLGSERP